MDFHCHVSNSTSTGIHSIIFLQDDSLPFHIAPHEALTSSTTGSRI